MHISKHATTVTQFDMSKRKIKVAIFHLAFIYSGGGEKLVLQEYDGLKKKGYDVSIFTTILNKRKSFPDIIGNYKIKTFLPNLRVYRGHEAFVTVLSCLLAPFYAYKFKDFDVILACNQPSPWIAYVINRIYKVPYISYLAQPTRFLHLRKIDRETGLFFAKKADESISSRLMMTTFRSFSLWADQISIKNSKIVLANGEYIKGIIEKVYNVKVVNCPSGVKIVNLSKIKKDNYLLVTNRHFPQKRIEYAIFVLNSIRQNIPNLRLIITGSNTEYTHSLKGLVLELGLVDFVDFVGYVSEKKLQMLYRRACCYLYTAPEEDFGMGIIEAMKYGTPVVAWNFGGPRKIITDNFDGLLAKPNDLNDFTDKVVKILNNKKLANNLTINAYKTILNKYSFTQHIQTIDMSINNVLLNEDEKNI